MRSLRLRQGVREAKQLLMEGGRLAHASLPATLALGFVLAALPAAIKAALFVGGQKNLLSLWEGWIGALMTSGQSAQSLAALVYTTMQQTGAAGLPYTALDLATSLIINPLMLSALALLYNGFVTNGGFRAAFDAAQSAGRNAKCLLIVALCLMLAEWFVQMVPSIASGLLSAVTGLLSFIPILGTVANILALLFSVLISLLTDFAVTVIFCYVWICVSCENISGFGALVRSWQLTRNATHETISSLLGLVVLRCLAVVALCVLWLFAGRPLRISLNALVYGIYLIGGVFTVMLGTVTSALYLRRPVGHGPQGGFSDGAANLHRMKRANIDE